MNIYHLLHAPTPQTVINTEKFYELYHIYLNQITNFSELSFDPEEITINQAHMQSSYGHKMSALEITYFLQHKNIWQSFLNTTEDWCLIIEDQAIDCFSFGNMESELAEFDLTIGIVFPFKKIKNGHSDVVFPAFGPYLLGYYWGAFAYFLSRKAAKALMTISVIKQPVDEEMLELSVTGKLEIFMIKPSFFDLSKLTSFPLPESRQQSIERALFAMNAWSVKDKIMVQKILSILSKLSIDAGVDLILDCGTLLGHIRHGGIMAWDDDVDIAINRSAYEKLLTAVTANGILQWDTFSWSSKTNECLYYKFWLKEGEMISGHQQKFPFVDIWLFEHDENNRIVFDDGRIFEKDLFYPLTTVSFEEADFKVPCRAIECLNIQYKDWDKYIQVFPYSHRAEKPAFHPLTAAIEVDKTGRMIDKDLSKAPTVNAELYNNMLNDKY